MKYNRHSWWILFILLFALVVHFVTAGRFLPGYGTFLTTSLLLGSAFLLWDSYYLATLEDTIHKFSNIHSGAVKQFKCRENSDITCFSARGNYYGRAFYIGTELIRRNYQGMNVRLKRDTPVYASFELKRKKWGKVDPDPLTIADVYHIRFTLPRTAPGVPSLHNSARFKEEFITLIDQQKLGVKLARLGKKHRDGLNRFYIYVDSKNIGVKKGVPIRSVDKLENLMHLLEELAKVIEELSQKYIFY